jgi:hypothetical protein
MKHKDKGETLSKEGCGRVVISKLYGVVCSYTMESSIFPAAYDAYIGKTVKFPERNTEFLLSPPDSQTLRFSPLHSEGQVHENVLVLENRRLGAAMMVSVLDMLEKNPYSRLKDGFVEGFCKELSYKLLQNEERFKMMDVKAHQKSRMIAEYLRSKFEDPLNR